ncbi:hypothetical protein Tco_1498019 [Tanacetum coccineum]
MVEPILYESTKIAQSQSNLSITNNNMKIDFSKEFLVELQKNMYHGTHNEDVVDHIAKVLKMVDLIYVPDVDSHKLRMKVFPLSLADDANEWWIRNNKRKESKYENPSNTATDSFFKAYDVRDIEKENGHGKIKRKENNNDAKQPNKRRCKAKKFEAIQYSIGPNEEYIAIRSYEYDIWERDEDNLFIIYQDIFHKKDKGWMVTRTKE